MIIGNSYAIKINPSSPEKTPVELPFRVEEASNPPPPETKLLVFGGKGGVGKTTLACATAIRLAQVLEGQQVLLFSTDPAHSLSDCLGLKIGCNPTRLSSTLSAMEVNPQTEFNLLKKQYQKELARFFQSLLPDIDLTFDQEVMVRIFDLSPPGLDEIMGLTRVMGFLSEGIYNLLILDSAPTGHLMRLLELPGLIDQWLKVFFGLFLKYKHVFRLPKISQKLVRMSMELKSLRSILNNPALSALYVVSILTEMAFEETKDLLAVCERMKINAPALFLNLATPVTSCSLCSDISRRESLIRDKFGKTYVNIQQTLVYRQGEPRGLPKLEKLGQALYRQ